MKFQIPFSILFNDRKARASRALQKFGAAAVLIVFSLPAFAQDVATSAREQERELIKVLESNVPPEQKAVPCKKLALYGTSAAVPALAHLLSDDQLASWALIALEAIPGSAPDDALRAAAEKLHGRLLVGVIDSIAVRRDSRAVPLLTKKLDDIDPQVASAAAVSLGKIGGQQAATALRHALRKAPEAVRSAVAEGCIRCAENFLASGKPVDAVKMYDDVRWAPLPRERTLEGLRGAILARGNNGIPLLMEELQSGERDFFNIGLRVARELPGHQATEAVIADYKQATTDRQPLVLLALSDREDPAVVPVVTDAAEHGAKELRTVAVDILDRWGEQSTLPVLLAVAADNDKELSEAGLAAVTRMAGNGVDSDLVAKLPGSSGKMRKALMIIAARRGTEKALPEIVQSVGDSDADTRGAAVQALVALGGVNEVEVLARALEKSEDSNERAHIESVLVTLCGRLGSKSTAPLLSLAQNQATDNKKAALQPLVAAGGSDALAAVASATTAQDESLQDEAVQALCSWPDSWPEDGAVAEPLLHVIKADAKSSHQVLALRSYLHFLLGDEKLDKDEKLTKLQGVMPLARRPEEKITAIAVLQSIPSGGALDVLENLATDSAVADDASAALVQSVAQNKSTLSTDERQKALQVAVQNSTKSETKQKAQDALKNL
ncbi:MAG TPA: HEAT repeat domain-containing protein [Verrucomicrobiae bacterium]|jgi:HEAT repeat protein